MSGLGWAKGKGRGSDATLISTFDIQRGVIYRIRSDIEDADTVTACKEVMYRGWGLEMVDWDEIDVK